MVDKIDLSLEAELTYLSQEKLPYMGIWILLVISGGVVNIWAKFQLWSIFSGSERILLVYRFFTV